MHPKIYADTRIHILVYTRMQTCPHIHTPYTHLYTEAYAHTHMYTHRHMQHTHIIPVIYCCIANHPDVVACRCNHLTVLVDSVGMARLCSTVTRASAGKTQTTGGIFNHMSDTRADDFNGWMPIRHPSPWGFRASQCGLSLWPNRLAWE